MSLPEADVAAVEAHLRVSACRFLAELRASQAEDLAAERSPRRWP
jgi:hypothetical protein